MSEKYDYIIVGAGSAGCVLANRLSKDPANKVLLLEAGGSDNSFLYQMPFGVALTFVLGFGNWFFRTVPQKHSNNYEYYQPRGKVLGGSSSTNAMLYIRGHPTDYDEWESLGNKGWSYKDVLPYFKKSEDHEDGESDVHGVGGPLAVTRPKFVNELSKSFVQAGVNLGFPKRDDFNDGVQEGFGEYQMTIKNGERCSAAKGFLNQAKSRPNLTIITGAHAEKVLFKGKVAVGVKYTVRKKSKTALADKEVILSAGAFQSPQLLLLSGVGPKNELEDAGVETLHNLPGVGKNLQDHTMSTIVVKEAGKLSNSRTLDVLPRMVKSIFNYVFRRKGPLTVSPAQGAGFIKSDPKQAKPDIQYHFIAAPVIAERGNKQETGSYGGHSFYVACTFLRPYSRGEVTLASNNPFDAPLIDPNYYADPRDVDITRVALKRGLELCNQSPMSDHVKKVLYPKGDLSADSQLDEHTRANSASVYHPVGTCKMGSDKMAVVDDQLRVHGLKNLRVVDASIMPTLVGGNTNAPTIMIAEKAADMILDHDSTNVPKDE